MNTDMMREPRRVLVRRVIGLAKGTGSTSRAESGALTYREYPMHQRVPREDWRAIIAIERAFVQEDKINDGEVR